MLYPKSHLLYERACKVIPGGVNSPVRSFNGVGGKPVFMVRGEGAYLFDADNNQYIDYVCSWGPLILGHAPSVVIAAIDEATQNGTSLGWATEREIELAERMVKILPAVEKIRFVNSGTEATMSALRVARGYTNREKIVKFSGCYHGHADSLLSASAGSGVATLGIPGSAGVTIGAVKDTITLAYNDLDQVEDTFRQYGETIAAVIIEPIAANMGLVIPLPGYLQGLRQLCDHYGILLIFDEVITGFRLAKGGAQAYFNIKPDLSTFGKIIGGGLPVGAYGGRSDILDKVAPLGPVYQAGTLSGNPLAMAAGIAVLDAIEQKDFYENLAKNTAELVNDLNNVFQASGNFAYAYNIASIFGIWCKPYAKTPPRNYEEVRSANSKWYANLFFALLEQGVALAPSAFEVAFVSFAHQTQHFKNTVIAFANAVTDLSNHV
ncbi:MAG: glutamate-1-semialdehyde 2,1-aminomutase [Deltaproteobacteria bacterium]|nr:glutamate-1-semialdehyde 2,1-aminomutase [Deltaproteobacteria bacterium]